MLHRLLWLSCATVAAGAYAGAILHFWSSSLNIMTDGNSAALQHLDENAAWIRAIIENNALGRVDQATQCVMRDTSLNPYLTPHLTPHLTSNMTKA